MAAALACSMAAERADAQEADACGAATSDGAVRCTAADNPYRRGISYDTSVDLVVAVDEDVAVEPGRNRPIGAAVRLIGRSDASVALRAADGSSVRTVGAGQAGLRARSESGHIEIVAPAIVTRAEDSAGIIARSTAGGDISITAASVRTRGDGSRGIVARTPAGGDIAILSSGLVRTGGADSTAILARSPLGSVRIDASDIRTLGDYSGGVDAIAQSIQISIGGAVTTRGEGAVAVSAEAGGEARIDVQDAITTGFGGVAIEAWGQSVDVTVHGTAASRGGAAVDALGSTLWAQGLADASGSGGDARVTNNGRVIAEGDNNAGLIAQADGNLYIQGAGSFATHGANSVAIDAWANRNLSINVGQVRTTGDNSVGIDIAGGQSLGAAVSAGSIVTTGDRSSGIRIARSNGGDMDLSIDVGSIATAGTIADGITLITDNRGRAEIRADRLEVAGLEAAGLYASAAGLDLDLRVGSALATGQAGAGIFASGANVTLHTSGTIANTGEEGRGISVVASRDARLAFDGDVVVSGRRSVAIGLLGTSRDSLMTVNMTGDIIASGYFSTGFSAGGEGSLVARLGNVFSGGDEPLAGYAIVAAPTGDVDLTVHDVTVSGYAIDTTFVRSREGNASVTVTGSYRTENSGGIFLGAVGLGQVSVRDMEIAGTNVYAISAVAGDVNVAVSGTIDDHVQAVSGGTGGPAIYAAAGGGPLAGRATVENGGNVNTFADERAAIRVQALENASLIGEGSVHTRGANATAVTLGAITGEVLLAQREIVTDGDFSSAIAIIGSSADVLVDVDRVATQGLFARGVDIFSTGQVLLDIGSIETSGGLSAGLRVSNSGGIAGSVDSISTIGNRSTALQLAAEGNIEIGSQGRISTAGEQANGIVASASGDLSTAAKDIQTQGTLSYGLSAEIGGDALLRLGTISTAGAEADGIRLAAGGGADIELANIATSGEAADGINVQAGGGVRAVIGSASASGETARAIAIASGGPIMLAVGSLDVSGPGGLGIDLASQGIADATASAGGVRVSDGTGIRVSAVQGAVVVAADQVEQASRMGESAIAATGAAGSLVYFGDVVSIGDGVDDAGLAAAISAFSQSGDVEVVGGSVSASGERRYAIRARSDGGDVLVDVDRIATHGVFANGIDISTTGQAFAGAGSIETSGEQSVGLNVSASGGIAAVVGTVSTIGHRSTALQLAAESDIGIAAEGRISTAGVEASGIIASTSADLSIATQDIGTQGSLSHGLLAAVGGDVVLRHGTISTDGDGADGISLVAGGAVDLELAMVATTGKAAGAIDIRAGGAVHAVVGSASVSGANARGIGISSADSIALAVGDLDMSGPGALGIDLVSSGDVLASAGGVRVGDGTGISASAVQGVAVVAADRVEQASRTGESAIAATGAAGSLVYFGDVVSIGDGVDDGGLAAAISAFSQRGDVEVVGGDVSAAGARRYAVHARSNDGDVLVDIDRIETNGALAYGAGIFAAGRAFLEVASIETNGEQSVGLSVSTSGGIAAALGSVSTAGDRSTATQVTSEGSIELAVGGRVSTAGDQASAIVASASGGLSVAVQDIGTRGALSYGLVADVAGDALLRHVTISTEGVGADGINLMAGGTADIMLAKVATTGESADGIDVRAGGAVRAAIGSVSVSGANARAIAIASEDAITITTEGDIRAADDAVILTAAAGASLVNNGIIVAGGSAIRASGGSATISNHGSIAGGIILGDAGDLVINGGTMVLTEARFGAGDDRLVNEGNLTLAGNLDFDGGNDALANRGILSLAGSASAGGGLRSLATSPVARSIAGLDSFANSGLIDLRSGVAGDALGISGSFAGTGDSMVILDVRFGDTPAADRLDIAGPATGSTGIAINPLDAPTALEPGIVLVTAGAGTQADAFQLIAPGSAGFFAPGLVFDAEAATVRLVTAPSHSAYRLLKISDGARSAWLESSDMVAAHLASGQGSGYWLMAGGNVNNRDHVRRFEAFGFGQDVDLGYEQDSFSTQLGYGVERGPFTIGVTAGYGSSVLTFAGSADRVEYDALNGGIYAALRSGRFRVNALAKYDHYDIGVSMPSMGERAAANGSAFGARIEAGVRLGSASFYAEPRVSLSYQHVAIDRLDLSAATRFDDRDGGRGALGIRVGGTRPIGAALLNVYAEADYLKALGDGARLLFATGSTTLDAQDGAFPDHGAAKLGLEITTARLSGFIEAMGRYGEDYRGGGARVGLRFAF